MSGRLSFPPPWRPSSGLRATLGLQLLRGMEAACSRTMMEYLIGGIILIITRYRCLGGTLAGGRISRLITGSDEIVLPLRLL